jgi:hypothetical protein
VNFNYTYILGLEFFLAFLSTRSLKIFADFQEYGAVWLHRATWGELELARKAFRSESSRKFLL